MNTTNDVLGLQGMTSIMLLTRISTENNDLGPDCSSDFP